MQRHAILTVHGMLVASIIICKRLKFASVIESFVMLYYISDIMIREGVLALARRATGVYCLRDSRQGSLLLAG